jgi:methylenetetrahydrofolate reductase (NADPH)
MTYESNKSHRGKGETLFSFEIIPPQRKSIQDLYDNIDPLMEFKPPFIDVREEEFILIRKWFTR